MSIVLVSAAIVSVLVGIYLFFAMLWPERLG